MELTLIARVRDGLILATSIEGSDGGDTNLVKYSNQAKMLFKKLHNAPQMQSIESGPYMFQYVFIVTWFGSVRFLCVLPDYGRFHWFIGFLWGNDVGFIP
ncbi:hypothetical protein ANCCAN_22274 [Ancylostoma caninum]|uniref:Longin domain-containing protein n=1 Tax=Ancylostoma caninum TaxID=29170 RepID=A0A368FM97_ANCCA|nr:hypothetical protein ANCCAN_22274 [Ancylostoma caninum]